MVIYGCAEKMHKQEIILGKKKKKVYIEIPTSIPNLEQLLVAFSTTTF